MQTETPSAARPASTDARPDGVRWTKNGLAVPLAEIPCESPAQFSRRCVDACRGGARVAALFSLPAAELHGPGGDELLAVLADDSTGRIGLLRGTVGPDRCYPALSAHLPEAQAFERELLEEHGIRPDGHPWPKPLRRHAARGGLGPTAGEVPLAYPFFRVDGPGIHEVGVGPVHAGIIEPGHFRFQCYGELVVHLEIQLGYQHRGAEELLLRSSPARQLVVAESVAGDTAVGHALAYCGVIEALAGIAVPPHAETVRGVALELERLANHAGDLGALAGDVGYLPGASWFGRLRGEFLNLLLEVSGSRFGRGLLRPGGVRADLSGSVSKTVLARLARIERDIREAADIVLGAPSVRARFEHTGVVPRDAAVTLGLVGPAARASGCDRDVRRDHPSGVYRWLHMPVALGQSGDVMARALVRWLEIRHSLAFVRAQLGKSSARGPLAVDVPRLRRASVAVSLVEGWRGEIVHAAVTADDGRPVVYKIVDPSLHNWLALAVAMRDGQISDFPLCNKSFNLSYAGHDR